MRIRFLHTASFRLAAFYTAAFAASVLVLGVSVLAVTERAMREQIVQYSQTDIAAINDGYVKEGVHEALEVLRQRMAGNRHTDFVLLQQDGRPLAGNLPAMAEREGAIEIANPSAPGSVVLGAGARLGPGLYAFSGSDLGQVMAVRQRILQLLLWLFAAALPLAALGAFIVSRGFIARMDAITRTCRAIMAGNLRDQHSPRAGERGRARPPSRRPSTPCSTASPR